MTAKSSWQLWAHRDNGIYDACASTFETTRQDARERLLGDFYGKRKFVRRETNPKGATAAGTTEP